MKTTSKLDGPIVAQFAPGLPQRGMPYQTSTEYDRFARVTRVNPIESGESWNVWYVDVEYDTQRPPDKNPFDDPPEISFDFETFRKPYPGKFHEEYDGNGGAENVFKAITNSAGEPFDPPIEYDEAIPILIITRNEPTFSSKTVEKYMNAVNSDAWAGHSPRHCKIKGIRGTKMYEPGENNNDPDITYWQVTYTIAINRESWDLRLLDVGTYYWQLDGSGDRVEGGRKQFVNRDGSPGLGYLDGDQGGKKAFADEPKYITVPALKAEAFSALNLPQDFDVDAWPKPGRRRARRE